MEKAVQSKKDIVNYIICLYYEKYKQIISPTKLQKSIYFLFAYWVSAVEQSKKLDDDFNEYSKFSNILFRPNFQAWQYGPVDKVVYLKWKKIIEKDKIQVIENLHTREFINLQNKIKKEVKEFIDDLLINTCFKSSVYTLVSRSHEDKCWNNNYNSNEWQEIPTKEIIDEYRDKPF